MEKWPAVPAELFDHLAFGPDAQFAKAAWSDGLLNLGFGEPLEDSLSGQRYEAMIRSSSDWNQVIAFPCTRLWRYAISSRGSDLVNARRISTGEAIVTNRRCPSASTNARISVKSEASAAARWSRVFHQGFGPRRRVMNSAERS